MLRQRIFSGGAMLLALFSAAWLLPAPGIAILIAALGLLGLHEYARLVGRAGIEVFTVPMLAGGILMTIAAYRDIRINGCSGGTTCSLESAALAVSLLLIMTLALRRDPGMPAFTNVAASLLGLLYLPLMLNFYMRLALFDPAPGGRMLALFPIVAVKMSDMGAFFCGRRFGRHKLCPRLSPGKTWEGLAGGMAAAVAVALVCSAITNPPAGLTTLWRPLPLALSAILLTLAGVAGDLGESFFKRVVGVKDSSGIIPGMGGVLDVLDSLLFAAPVFYIIVRIVIH